MKNKKEEKLTTDENENLEDSKNISLNSDDNEKKDDQTILTPLEDYIKTASYLGTKVITPTMRKYVYRRRLDGLAILNTQIGRASCRERV